MARRRTRTGRGHPRRQFIRRLGGGVILLAIGGLAVETAGFSSMRNPKNAAADVAADDQAIVGIVNRGPVQRNSQDPMVDITNNWTSDASYTVSLGTCSDGTLYDFEGDSGCSVTFSVSPGETVTVDIEAAVTGTIPFSISATGPDLSFATDGSVDAEAGNVTSAVDIRQPDSDNDFTAVSPQGNQGNEFEVSKVDIRDGDGDDDLVEVYYEVFEGDLSGTKVAEKTVTLSPTGRYAPTGNPAEIIQPDNDYTISSGQLYTLRVTGTDADGNFDSVSVQDTP